MAYSSSAKAGRVLLNGTNPNGAINRRAARMKARLLITLWPGPSMKKRNRCGRLIFSMRRTQTRPPVSPGRSRSAGKALSLIRCGSHSGRLISRLTPTSRMAAPKTVLTPGIDTGIRKTSVSRMVSSNRPSSLKTSSSSPRLNVSGGRRSMMPANCSPSDAGWLGDPSTGCGLVTPLNPACRTATARTRPARAWFPRHCHRRA